MLRKIALAFPNHGLAESSCVLSRLCPRGTPVPVGGPAVAPPQTGTKRGFQRSARLLLLAALLLLLGAPLPGAAAEEETPFIAILLSDREEAYARATGSFQEEFKGTAKIFSLEGNIANAPTVMAAVMASKPSLIFSLGAKASYAAKTWTRDRQDIPVIFAMVLNWEKYDMLKEQKNIAGIDFNVDPGTQMANMLMVSPGVKRIGIVYSSEYSTQTVARIKQAAQILNVEVHDRVVAHPSDFRRIYKELSGKIDGFWILNDPVFYTIDNISWLENRCVKDKIVCLGHSANIAKLGVLLSIEPDSANIGSQAAALAKSFLSGKQTPEETGVMPPLGTRLFLNNRTAVKIDLHLSDIVLESASDIIE